MTDVYSVQEQLRRIGSDFRFWGRSEVKELPKILFPDEAIMHALNGRYEKGFALFCATDQRLLLLDKKPLILCFEDMRYEMISEVDYTEQLLSASLSLRTPGRTLKFVSYRIARLRNLTSYIQEKVTYFRHLAAGENNQPQENYNAYLQGTQQEENRGYQGPVQPYAYPATHKSYRNPAMRIRRQVPKFAHPTEPSKP